ncbi:MAG: hypothetical protein HY675_12450 [Chloroflexi bacterium]|nr:hypothetical protein [Chloroflexota bacterium]
MRDTLRLEQANIPTVTIVSSDFIELARYTSSSLGMPDQCFVEIQHPIGGLSPDEIAVKVRQVFPEILHALTEWRPSPTDDRTDRSPYPAEVITFKGTVPEVQSLFLERGLSVGLPFVPPTRDLVREMLAGTSHWPDEVVWQGIPPRMGIVTVELVAACAAMAGCKPSYIPVLLAALEAMKDPVIRYTHIATTTGTESLLVLVNGPIVREIELATGTGAAGLCYHANASIGYAIGLIAKIVGGSKPPDRDKSTMASPADLLHYVFGENESESPWESYAVEHGFNKTDDVVTVKGVYQSLDVSEHNSPTGEGILNYTARSINQPYTYPLRHEPVLLGWCPEHAAVLARDGYTKDSIRHYLWQHARYPSTVYAEPAWERGKCGPTEDFPDLGFGSDTLLPIVARPEDFQMIVCGGAGKHSQFWPGPKAMASRLVDRWR